MSAAHRNTPTDKRSHLGDLARQFEPWPLGTSAMIRILAWPDYKNGEQIRKVLQVSSRLFGHGDACLCLRYDSTIDLQMSQVIENIELQLQQRPEVREEKKDINILIIDDAIPHAHWYRVGLTAFCAVGFLDATDDLRAQFIREQHCEKMYV